MQNPHPIAAVLAERRLTRRAVADAAGVNPGTFGRIVNGYQAPWPALRRFLSGYLDVDDAALFRSSITTEEPHTGVAAEALVAGRTAQGLEATVTDPAVLRRVADILVGAADRLEAVAAAVA